MGCLQVRRWLSFLPAAFVVYLLLHYLVYQPDLSTPPQSPLLDEGLTRPNDTLVGVAGGSRSLQSGPRVLPPLTPQEVSAATAPSEEPPPAEASPGGRRPDATNGTSTLPGSASPPPSAPLGALEEVSSGPPINPDPSTPRPAPLIPQYPPRHTPVVPPSPRPPPFMPEYGGGFPGPANYPAPPSTHLRPGTAALARHALRHYQQQQQQQQQQGVGYAQPQFSASYAQSRAMTQMGHPLHPAHNDLSPVYDPFGYLEGHDLTMGEAPRQRAGNAVHGSGGSGGASSSFIRPLRGFLLSA